MPLIIPQRRRVIAQSAVAVPLTGTAVETALATVSIPAGSMGPNGRVIAVGYFSMTNSANTKTLRIRWNGISGSVMTSSGLTTSATWRTEGEVANRNATNSQVTGPNNAASVYNQTPTAITTASVDTTAAVDVVFTGALSNTGETITLEYYRVEVVYGG